MAREIIENNQYVSLGTTNAKGDPWISPVVYAFDGDWNFYFSSLPDSRHCSNIRENNKTAMAIFDSHQNTGEGAGLQIEGVTRELKGQENLKAAVILFQRKYPYGKHPSPGKISKLIKKAVSKRNMYKFYKITPITVWMNNPNTDIDLRVRIDLLN